LPYRVWQSSRALPGKLGDISSLARQRIRRPVILLSIFGNSITAASQSKAILCHPRSIIIANYLQQR
jgi:hypothetical protein